MLDHPLIEFIGQTDEGQKSVFLGGARALLFPIDWMELFGLVMIEAMSAGTPVIAWRNGSVPTHRGGAQRPHRGYDGHGSRSRRPGPDDGSISHPALLRSRFTAARMAGNYVAVYEDLIGKPGARAEREATE
jgi:hypothetical protein